MKCFLLEQDRDERLRQPADILREGLQRRIEFLLPVDQAGGVVAGCPRARSRLANVEDFVARVVRPAEVPRAGQRQFVQEDQERDLLRAVLRRLGGRLEDLRQSDDLRELHDPHGAASALHEIQSEQIERGKAGKHNQNSFQFRVALLLSENEAIYSEPSVVISTNEEGVPESSPTIDRIGAVDQTRIMVSWKPGPKNNGPILSYNLQIRDLTQPGYNALKVPPMPPRLAHV